MSKLAASADARRILDRNRSHRYGEDQNLTSAAMDADFGDFYRKESTDPG